MTYLMTGLKIKVKKQKNSSYLLIKPLSLIGSNRQRLTVWFFKLNRPI